MYPDEKKNPKGLRVIKTARDQKSINHAAKEGFWPLVKKVEPHPDIKSKFALYQSKLTGEIKVVGDLRSRAEEDYVRVIDWQYYYPYSFTSPYAAYLVPTDLVEGERVFLEDLIEDVIGSTWNQGCAWRLESCEAVWNGIDFILGFNPERDRQNLMG